MGRRRRVERMQWQLFVALCLSMAGLLLATAVSFAYALPVHSSPAEGDAVRGTPQQVSIQFNQKLDPIHSQIQVYDADGTRVDLQNCGIDVADPRQTTMVVNLRPSLPAGDYTVRWTAVSATNNEPLNGQYQFTILPPIWLLSLQGLLVALVTAVALGGWLGFGLTYRRLKRLEKMHLTPPTNP